MASAGPATTHNVSPSARMTAIYHSLILIFSSELKLLPKNVNVLEPALTWHDDLMQHDQREQDHTELQMRHTS